MAMTMAMAVKEVYLDTSKYNTTCKMITTIV